MPKKKWYVVTTGREVGVFTTWLEVAPLVSGISSAQHQSFASEEEAIEAFEREQEKGNVKVVGSRSIASRSSSHSSPRSPLLESPRERMSRIPNHPSIQRTTVDRTRPTSTIMYSNRRVFGSAVDDLLFASVGSPLTSESRLSSPTTNVTHVVGSRDSNLPARSSHSTSSDHSASLLPRARTLPRRDSPHSRPSSSSSNRDGLRSLRESASRTSRSPHNSSATMGNPMSTPTHPAPRRNVHSSGLEDNETSSSSSPRTNAIGSLHVGSTSPTQSTIASSPRPRAIVYSPPSIISSRSSESAGIIAKLTTRSIIAEPYSIPGPSRAAAESPFSGISYPRHDSEFEPSAERSLLSPLTTPRLRTHRDALFREDDHVIEGLPSDQTQTMIPANGISLGIVSPEFVSPGRMAMEPMIVMVPPHFVNMNQLHHTCPNCSHPLPAYIPPTTHTTGISSYGFTQPMYMSNTTHAQVHDPRSPLSRATAVPMLTNSQVFARPSPNTSVVDGISALFIK